MSRGEAAVMSRGEAAVMSRRLRRGAAVVAAVAVTLFVNTAGGALLFDDLRAVVVRLPHPPAGSRFPSAWDAGTTHPARLELARSDLWDASAPPRCLASTPNPETDGCSWVGRRATQTYYRAHRCGTSCSTTGASCHSSQPRHWLRAAGFVLSAAGEQQSESVATPQAARSSANPYLLGRPQVGSAAEQRPQPQVVPPPRGVGLPGRLCAGRLAPTRLPCREHRSTRCGLGAGGNPYPPHPVPCTLHGTWTNRGACPYSMWLRDTPLSDMAPSSAGG